MTDSTDSTSGTINVNTEAAISAPAPVIPAPPAITAEHKESLLQKLEGFPKEFIEWFEKHI